MFVSGGDDCRVFPRFVSFSGLSTLRKTRTLHQLASSSNATTSSTSPSHSDSLAIAPLLPLPPPPLRRPLSLGLQSSIRHNETFASDAIRVKEHRSRADNVVRGVVWIIFGCGYLVHRVFESPYCDRLKNAHIALNGVIPSGVQSSIRSGIQFSQVLSLENEKRTRSDER